MFFFLRFFFPIPFVFFSRMFPCEMEFSLIRNFSIRDFLASSLQPGHMCVHLELAISGIMWKDRYDLKWECTQQSWNLCLDPRYKEKKREKKHLEYWSKLELVLSNLFPDLQPTVPFRPSATAYPHPFPLQHVEIKLTSTWHVSRLTTQNTSNYLPCSEIRLLRIRCEWRSGLGGRGRRDATPKLRLEKSADEGWLNCRLENEKRRKRGTKIPGCW